MLKRKRMAKSRYQHNAMVVNGDDNKDGRQVQPAGRIHKKSERLDVTIATW